MKNISTGFGLCVLGLGIAAWPVLDRIMPTANAGAVTAAVAVTSAASAQTGPTIVWYSWSSDSSNTIYALVRAWSDGKVGMRRINGQASQNMWCSTSPPPQDPCAGPWIVINDPAQGLTYRSDINFDEKVDGADLATLLNDWGNAPRQDIPPSDCPLALINP